jgi:hypothetical protein
MSTQALECSRASIISTLCRRHIYSSFAVIIQFQMTRLARDKISTSVSCFSFYFQCKHCLSESIHWHFWWETCRWIFDISPSILLICTLIATQITRLRLKSDNVSSRCMLKSTTSWVGLILVTLNFLMQLEFFDAMNVTCSVSDSVVISRKSSWKLDQKHGAELKFVKHSLNIHQNYKIPPTFKSTDLYSIIDEINRDFNLKQLIKVKQHFARRKLVITMEFYSDNSQQLECKRVPSVNRLLQSSIIKTQAKATE